MTPAEHRRSWAYTYIQRAKTPPPQYGSAEWLALPEGPDKVAAVVIAAERAIYYDTIADLETAAQASWMTHLHRLAEEGDWQARNAYHRQAWTGSGFRHDQADQDAIDLEWRQWIDGGAA